MRAFHAVVFDDIVQNTTPVYTDPEHNGILGSADKMSLQVISNVLSGGPALTVAVEHSADDEIWVPCTVTPELNRVSLSWTDTNNHVVSYDSGGSALCRVRLRVELSGSATVRVKITACGRSHMRRDPTSSEATDAESNSEIQDVEAVWPFPGGDDALLDERTKNNLRILEDMRCPGDAMLAYARNYFRRQAWARRIELTSQHHNNTTPDAGLPAASACACSPRHVQGEE